MIRVLGATIFLSLILFSCSKSVEDQIIGTWNLDGEEITFHIDKTYTWDSDNSRLAWKFDEPMMEICLMFSGNWDCANIVSIEKNKLCLNDGGDGFCMYRVK